MRTEQLSYSLENDPQEEAACLIGSARAVRKYLQNPDPIYFTTDDQRYLEECSILFENAKSGFILKQRSNKSNWANETLLNYAQARIQFPNWNEDLYNLELFSNPDVQIPISYSNSFFRVNIILRQLDKRTNVSYLDFPEPVDKLYLGSQEYTQTSWSCLSDPRDVWRQISSLSITTNQLARRENPEPRKVLRLGHFFMQAAAIDMKNYSMAA